MTVALLCLGAGKGERMGGPKALLLVDGLPLAALHTRRAPEGVRVIHVVRAEVARTLAPFALDQVVSEADDALGPAGSIHAAVAAGALDLVDRVLVTPVDVPPCPKEQLDALLAALDHADAARFERGHPIAIRGDVLRARYRDAAPILRDVLGDLGARCVTLGGTAGPADLDDPTQVLRVTGGPPRFFSR